MTEQKSSVKNLLSHFNPKTLRFRMLTGYVLMVLITAVSISAGTFFLGIQNARNQTSIHLSSIIQQKMLMVDAWKTQLQGDLYTALSEEYALDRIQAIIRLDLENRYSHYYTAAVRLRLKTYVTNSTHIQEIFILNRQGVVILSTDASREGRNYYFSPFFMRGIEKPSLELILSEEDGLVEETLIAIPIIASDGKLLGVMAGSANPLELYTILADTSSIGRTGKNYLIFDSKTILTVDNNIPSSNRLLAIPLQTSEIPYVDAGTTFASGIYPNFEGNDVLGVLRWVPALQCVMVIEEDNQEVFQSILNTLNVNILIGLTAILIAVVFSILTVQRIVRPIDRLVQITSQVAEGDLNQTVRVSSEDEIGSLARSFNIMTLQLGELINNLESKVEERTRALQHRTTQLETILNVNRQITSLLNIDTLLANVTQLIHEAFPLYNAFIFLIDEKTGFLNLRAASNERAEELSDMKNRLQKYYCESALSIEVKSRYLLEGIKFLPPLGVSSVVQTTLAIPLGFGGELSGIMVIHCKDEVSLTQEDVLVIQNLAEQIAIAIENAHRYDRIQHIAVIEERNRLARDMHDSAIQSLYSFGLLIEAWRMMLKSGSLNNMEDVLDRSKEINQQVLKEMRLMVHELRPPQLRELGLWGALIQRLDSVEKRMGIDAHLDVQEFIDLPPDIEETVYRIAQEALNNALKHSDASKVTIHFTLQDDLIFMDVTDNGRGFDMTTIDLSGRLGIENMHERARQAGGTLKINSNPGQGTTVQLNLPCQFM